MICLNSTDVLEAWSDTDAVIDCSIHGLVGTTFTNLYTGTLNNTPNTVVYTAGAAISIVSVSFVNTGGAAATVNFKLDPADGGNDKFLIPVAVSLGAGYGLVFDGQRFSVMDTSGQIVSTFPSPLLVANGGTGRVTSTTAYGLLAAGTTATGAHQTLAAGLTTQILVGGGAVALPSWGTDLPTAVTIGGAYVYRAGGTDVAVADGGTNISSYAVGDLIYASGATTLSKLADVAVGRYLASGGVGVAPAWAALNQAAVSGLTTGSSPVFVTVKCSGLTNGYVPYHVADATGLANSPIYTDGTSVGIGTTVPLSALHIKGNIILRNITGDATVDTIIGYISGQPRLYGADEGSGIANIAFRTDPAVWYKGGITFSTNNVDGTSPANPPVERMRITASGNVGIGTTTIPHGGVGAAKFAIEGTNASSAGPHIQVTTATDDYPLLVIRPWTHDNTAIAFDAYRETSWLSSDAGSNFLIYKYSDLLSFRYDSGNAQGGVVTWNDGIVLDTSGIVSMPAVYGHDMNGETIRDLQINNSGELGYDSSAKRKKTKIKDMEDTGWLYDLRPVNYYPKANKDMKRWGLIADEVESVNPAFCFYDEEGQVEGIHKTEFIFPILNEVQKHELRIKELESEVESLRTQIN